VSGIGVISPLGNDEPSFFESLAVGRSGSGRMRQWGNALVVAEISLTLMLTLGAGLLVRSFVRLRDVNAGFDPSHVFTARVALPPSRYATGAQARLFWHQLIDRVRSVSGAQSVGAVRALPMTGTLGDWSFQVQGRAEYGAHEWKDTVNLPTMQSLDLLVRYDARPGPWMFQCHILDHAAIGMMGTVQVDP